MDLETEPGEGCTFRVLLPLLEHPTRPRTYAASCPLNTSLDAGHPRDKEQLISETKRPPRQG